jgi:hypothetical protein
MFYSYETFNSFIDDLWVILFQVHKMYGKTYKAINKFWAFVSQIYVLL